MGLDTTHGAWHGPYSMFMRWRIWLAKQTGVPLMLMQGFVDTIPDDTEKAVIDAAFPIATSQHPYASTSCIRNCVVSMAELGKPIQWNASDPLTILLSHSDCDGKIKWWDCKALALRLTQVYRQSAGQDVIGHGPDTRRGCYDSMRKATLRFALGCLRAYRAREHLKFH